MEKLVITSYEDFASHLGEQLGQSKYVALDQQRINMFADATLDHQWIHVDTERAAAETPYKSTIAHGYLTMSLLPHLWYDSVDVQNVKMLVNYGMKDMKFGQPVLAGQSIRLTTTLAAIANLRGAVKAEVKFTMDIKETGKKALEGTVVFVYYFNS